MIRNTFILYILLFLAPFHSSLLAQTDTLNNHQTIKVSKPKDSTYIKAYSNFYVYYNNPLGDLSYKDFALKDQQTYHQERVSARVKIIDAKPKNDTSLHFNYASYFRNNHFTKDIKMRPEETDTVRLLFYIDNKGIVEFNDLNKIKEYNGIPYVFNKSPFKEFKEDNCHLKTQNALNELIKECWQPATIYTLKTHPSKRRNKYKKANGFSEGLLTIIYSSSPIED